MDSETCSECGGAGFIVTCCDDICNGLGYCIHGDGEMTCPACHGEGEVFFDDDNDGRDCEPDEVYGWPYSDSQPKP